MNDPTNHNTKGTHINAPRILCSTCDPIGTGRYCARLACLCGHPECWAYATWRPARRVEIKTYENTERIAASWRDREGPSWLDG